ncbi:ABC transporter permease [Haliovirga abyssi]|uniref:Membrane protein n=1 Tax=Haliovirga abyssi TaxID=2996794 RepID=A0AAU9DYR7_9FUSO|nr:ABC transporter permease [Haliovirga abyssi]BDU50585.1 membrane protein [Haliovirga abyssi]
MVELFIATKHIKERKKQSIISVIGIAIGMIVLLVSLGIASGLDENMIKNILSMTAHITLTNSESSISDYTEMEKKISSIKGVKSVAAVYDTQGIIKYEDVSGNYVSGISIKGISEEDAIKNLHFDKKIIKGHLKFDKLSSIIVGKELFNALGAKLGDKVKIISSENKELNLTIVGVFQSGFYDFDTSLVIIPLRTVQILSDSGDTTTSLEVKIKNIYAAKKIGEEIFNKTGLAYRTWSEKNRNLLRALSLEKMVMILVLSLIIIISGFVVGVILNTLVREKTKDIGVLRAIGYSKDNIMKIFLLEGLILGVVGIILGIVISGIILYILKTYSISFLSQIYYIDKLPVNISWREFAVVSGATFIIVLISSIFPAYKAANLKPVEALKYE